MQRTTTPRTILFPMAAAVLLIGTAACGAPSGAESTASADDVSAVAADASDGGASSDAAASDRVGSNGSTATEASDDGASASDGGAADAGGASEEASVTPGDSPTSSAQTEPQVEGGASVWFIASELDDAVDTSGETWMASGSQIEQVLTETSGAATSASCEGDLRFEQGSSVSCTAVFDGSGLDGEQVITVLPVRAPAGYDPDGRPALLVELDASPLPDAAKEVFTDQSNMVTGIELGHLYSSEELGGVEVAESVRLAVNGEESLAPADDDLVVESCDEMSGAPEEPVRCAIRWAQEPEGETWTARVHPVAHGNTVGGPLVALDFDDRTE